MTITAQGPRLAVSLNGAEVSTIDLDLWTIPGKRPDGFDHKFKNAAVASLARRGFLGFQDLGSDCWFKNIVLTARGSALDHPTRSPSSLAAPAEPTRGNWR
jgi:hypothetical protein